MLHIMHASRHYVTGELCTKVIARTQCVVLRASAPQGKFLFLFDDFMTLFSNTAQLMVNCAMLSRSEACQTPSLVISWPGSHLWCTWMQVETG